MSASNRSYSGDMSLGVSGSLSSLVAHRFAAAKEAGGLLFSHTEVTTLPTSKATFQLRYCPALAKKPSQAPAEANREDHNVKRDPFQNPSSDLLVSEIPQPNPTHVLVLNKFPVIPNHFILATKQNKPQDDLLDKRDLEVTYSCLKSWDTPDSSQPCKKLFAFFNSGAHSGASQPHRHLQFLPVEDMTQSDDNLNWEPLIDNKISDSDHTSQNFYKPRLLDLPFTCYAIDLPLDPSADDLHQSYLSLYRMARAVTKERAPNALSTVAEQPTLQTDGPAEISYNLALTTSRMMICPRISEHSWVDLDGNSKEGYTDEGMVKLNGTILAGTLMVKAGSEWEALQNQPGVLEGILQTVGIPRALVGHKEEREVTSPNRLCEWN